MHPFFLIATESRRRIQVSGLVVTLEVAFDEIAIFNHVFDWVAMVAAWQLDYLVKTNMVELASLLLVRCLWTLLTAATNSLSRHR